MSCFRIDDSEFGNTNRNNIDNILFDIQLLFKAVCSAKTANTDRLNIKSLI